MVSGATGGGTVEVRDNRIGVAGVGIAALPNNAYGVYLGYGSCGAVASAPAFAAAKPG